MRAIVAAISVAAALLAGPATADRPPVPRPTTAPSAAAPTPDVAPPRPAEPARGPVTRLPLPRFVSMKAAEGFMRRGPSPTHRVDWVLVRRHVPLLVTGEYGHWRRVEDREGATGWMHYSLLSGSRTALVEADELPLRRRPADDAPLRARLERGVIVHVDRCDGTWCRVGVGRTRGWARQAALWGLWPGEVRDD